MDSTCNRKQFIFILFIGFLSLNSFAQDIDLPKNAKKGECYIACEKEDGTFSKREKIACDFLVYSKNTEALKTLQTKLSNLGYDVHVSGKTDVKTIVAYKQYTKDEKKRLRKAKKTKA